MKRAYIAAPFNCLTSEVPGRLYGEISDRHFMSFLESIERVLAEFDFNVCIPHRDRGAWGKIYIHPRDIAEICFDEVSASDLVIAIPGNSRGVLAELGWAAYGRKPLIIFIKSSDDPSIFIYGLGKKTPTSMVYFE